MNDDDDDFFAELDGDMNPVELNDHPAERDDDLNHLDYFDDSIPEDVLNDIENTVQRC